MIAKNAEMSKEFKMRKNMRKVDQGSIEKSNLVVFIFAFVNAHYAYVSIAIFDLIGITF